MAPRPISVQTREQLGPFPDTGKLVVIWCIQQRKTLPIGNEPRFFRAFFPIFGSSFHYFPYKYSPLLFPCLLIPSLLFFLSLSLSFFFVLSVPRLFCNCFVPFLCQLQRKFLLLLHHHLHLPLLLFKARFYLLIYFFFHYLLINESNGDTSNKCRAECVTRHCNLCLYTGICLLNIYCVTRLLLNGSCNRCSQ